MVPGRGRGGGGGRSGGAREPSGGAKDKPSVMGTQLCPWDAQLENPLSPNHPCQGSSLFPLCFPNSQTKGCSRFGRRALPRRRSWRPARRFLWGLSAAELQKGNIDASSAHSIRPGPKNHHFLLACESLINSRQKGLIRKLFGKWRGRGRDRCSPPGPVALGGFAPRRHLPAPQDGSLPRGPRVCFGHGPRPEPSPGGLSESGCKQSSPADGFVCL